MSKFDSSGQGGAVSAKARFLGAQAGRRPESPLENPAMVVGTARAGPLHLAHNRGWAHPWPQVPRSSLGTLMMRGHRTAGKCGQGKM